MLIVHVLLFVTVLFKSSRQVNHCALLQKTDREINYSNIQPYTTTNKPQFFELLSVLIVLLSLFHNILV